MMYTNGLQESNDHGFAPDAARIGVVAIGGARRRAIRRVLFRTPEGGRRILLRWSEGAAIKDTERSLLGLGSTAGIISISSGLADQAPERKEERHRT